jgi:Tol biopolymer transport system component
MTRRTCSLILVIIFALLVLPASSRAAFPGANGQIAFEGGDANCCGGMSVMNPDGTDPHRLDSFNGDDQPVWSPDGRRIAFSSHRDGNFEIYVMSLDGTGQTRVTNDPAIDRDPAWSPDGQQIAFTRNDGVGADIYVVDITGGTASRLTSFPGLNEEPAWSPNGQTIAFTSVRFGLLRQIWVMDANGFNQRPLLAPHPGDDLEPEWSPDGQRLAFTSDRGASTDIYVVNADGTGPQINLTNNPAGAGSPAWSPDGQRIAFASNRSGNADIYAMNANGSGLPDDLTNSPPDEMLPSWQPLPPDSATIAVKNEVRPTNLPERFDLFVDSIVVRHAAADGQGGTALVDPGTHIVQATEFADFTDAIACTKNGVADTTVPSPPGVAVDVGEGDVEICTITHTSGEPTPVGSNVMVTPIDVTTHTAVVSVRFADVRVAGVTTLTTSASGPALPAGFELAGVYYHLETSAQFTTAHVCFPDPGPPAATITHWINGVATPETTTRDPFSGLLCADVTTFSPFALTRRSGGADTDAPQIDCGTADDAWHAGNVSIGCTAQDPGSGLADPADAAFSLSTSVPAGTEDASAATGSHQACDLAGNCATAGPIGGNRVDRKAPALALLSDRTADATAPQGATVSFSATASDGADTSPRVSCAPASGTTFAIGATTVRCTATDHVGNAADGSFRVTVLGAKEQLDRLVRSVVAAAALPAAVKAQLLAKLQSIVAGFDPANPAQRAAVCTALSSFSTVVALLSGHGITPAQATAWIADANRIRAVIACAPVRPATGTGRPA